MIHVNAARSSNYPTIATNPSPPTKIPALSVANNFTEHTHYVTCLDILAGDQFVSGSYDGTVKKWVNSSTKSLHTYSQSMIESLAVLGDHTCIAMGFGPGNNTLRIFNLIDQNDHPLTGHSDYVRALAVSEKGLLASGSMDGTVRVWEPFSSKLVGKYNAGSPVYCVKFLKDGKTIIGGNGKGEIQFWDYTSSDPIPYKTYQKNTKAVCSLAVMNDGTIVSGADDCVVRTWDPSAVPKEAQKKELPGHTGNVSALVVRPDNFLVSGSSDRTIIVWDISSGDFWQSPTEHKGTINSLATFADNSVISGSNDHTIKLWT